MKLISAPFPSPAPRTNNLLAKLTFTQPFKLFRALYGIWRPVTVITTAGDHFLSCARLNFSSPTAIYKMRLLIKWRILTSPSLRLQPHTNAHTNSHTLQAFDNSLGSLTLPATEARRFVQLLLLYNETVSRDGRQGTDHRYSSVPCVWVHVL